MDYNSNIEENKPYEEALDYAIKNVNVINLSVSPFSTHNDVEELYKRAMEKGVVIVAAAGNSGMNIDNHKQQMPIRKVTNARCPKCPAKSLYKTEHCQCLYPPPAPTVSTQESIITVAALYKHRKKESDPYTYHRAHSHFHGYAANNEICELAICFRQFHRPDL